MGADDGREDRQEEEYRLRIERIGGKAEAESLGGRLALGRLIAFRALDLDLRLAGTERLDADIDQVSDAAPFDDVEEVDRLRNDQPQTEDRVSHMEHQRGADAEGRDDGRAPAMHDRLAHDHGQIGAGRDDRKGEDRHQRCEF
ncbi:hypothetical protein D9M72_559070 [compost metagenome]